MWAMQDGWMDGGAKLLVANSSASTQADDVTVHNFLRSYQLRQQPIYCLPVSLQRLHQCTVTTHQR